MSALEDRLRETFDAHRADAPATDIVWQDIRTNGRRQRTTRRARHLGAVLAAAMLVVVTVVTVRILRTDETAETPFVNSGPTAPSMDENQRRLLETSVELGHQLDLEGLLSTTWMAERGGDRPFDPLELKPAEATVVVTQAQIQQQRPATDRAREAFDAAATSLTSRASIPTDELNLLTSVKAAQSRLQGLSTIRVSVDNLQTDPANALDQYVSGADSMRDVSASIGRVQPSASLSLDVEKVAVHQSIEVGTAAQAGSVMQIVIAPSLFSAPDSPTYPVLQRLVSANSDVERLRNDFQDLVDPTAVRGTSPPNETPFVRATATVTIAARNGFPVTPAGTTPPQILDMATTEVGELHRATLRALTQVGVTPRSQFIPNDTATGLVRTSIDLAHQLDRESVLSAAHLADSGLVGQQQLDEQRRVTNAAVTAWKASVPATTRTIPGVPINKAESSVNGLATLRGQVDQGVSEPATTVAGYAQSSIDILDLGKRIALATHDLSRSRALITSTRLGRVESFRGVEVGLFVLLRTTDSGSDSVLFGDIKTASDSSARADKAYDENAEAAHKQTKRDALAGGAFDDQKDRLFRVVTGGQPPSTSGLTAADLLTTGMQQLDTLHAANLKVLESVASPSPSSTAAPRPSAPTGSMATTPTSSSTVATARTEPVPAVSSSATVPSTAATSVTTATSSAATSSASASSSTTTQPPTSTTS